LADLARLSEIGASATEDDLEKLGAALIQVYEEVG
jgi:hypothetical protein